MSKPTFTQKRSGKCSAFNLKLHKSSPHPLCAFSTRSCRDLPSFLRLYKLRPKDIVSAEQVHDDKIAVVTNKDKGRTIRGADALITEQPHLPLVIRTADCVPIIIFDKSSPAIGIVHAGWRGSLKKIVPKTLRLMQKAFDTKIKNCIIAVGPSIGACCYEIDEKIVKLLKRACKDWRETAAAKKGDKWMLDLMLVNELLLIEAGLGREQIIKINKCTCCGRRLFHSYRRRRTEKRNYTLAML